MERYMIPIEMAKHRHFRLVIESSWRIALAVVMALLLGWATGSALLLLVLVLGAYSLWSWYNLYRFERWLRLDKNFHEPDAFGIWEDIFFRISQIKKKYRREKHAMISMLQRSRDAVDALPEGVIALSPDYRLVWFNRAAGRYLGLRNPGDNGERIGNLVRIPTLTQWLANEPEREPIELTIGREEQRIFHASMVRFAEDNRLVTLRNVTERRRLEEIRRDFVANVSHELRTPLTVITGYLEVLHDDADAAEEGPLREMSAQAERMRKLVDDLLSLARHERSQEAAPQAPIDMQELCHAMQRQAQAISHREHDLVFDFQAGLGLLGDGHGINSAFLNLISNAIRYTDAGGTIQVRWYLDRNEGIFEVRDTGSGIAAHHIPRLTERFYRVSVHRSRATGGTGLGLAIVKHVLRQHGARLEIHSTPGEGSTFCCRFPAARISIDLQELVSQNDEMLSQRSP